MPDAESLVRRIIRDAFGVEAGSVERMTFGHSSQVFDVALPDHNVIVRLNSDRKVFAGTQRNLSALGALGLPVPQVLASDLTLRRYPAAFIILAKIPGCDLRYALAEMRREQRVLWESLQRRVQRPNGGGALPGF